MVRYDVCSESSDGVKVAMTPFADRDTAVEWFMHCVKLALDKKEYRRVQLFEGKNAIYPILAFDINGNAITTLRF